LLISAVEVAVEVAVVLHQIDNLVVDRVEAVDKVEEIDVAKKRADSISVFVYFLACFFILFLFFTP
jgi:hypothetical protein